MCPSLQAGVLSPLTGQDVGFLPFHLSGVVRQNRWNGGVMTQRRDGMPFSYSLLACDVLKGIVFLDSH